MTGLTAPIQKKCSNEEYILPTEYSRRGPTRPQITNEEYVVPHSDKKTHPPDQTDIYPIYSKGRKASNKDHRARGYRYHRQTLEVVLCRARYKIRLRLAKSPMSPSTSGLGKTASARYSSSQTAKLSVPRDRKIASNRPSPPTPRTSTTGKRFTASYQPADSKTHRITIRTFYRQSMSRPYHAGSDIASPVPSPWSGIQHSTRYLASPAVTAYSSS